MDLVVIGGGVGGYVAALSAAGKGASVTLVEKDLAGGTCLNRGCIPTKAILHSAHAYHHAQKSFPGMGINLEGISLDFGAVMGNKDRIVAKLRGGVEYLLKKNGVKVINGEASFTDARDILVATSGGSLTLSADAVLIATGSKPAGLPFAEFDGTRILSSDHVLQMTEKPSSLAIVGGGVIGCEFAQAFARLGVRVSIVEMLPRLIANMDPVQSSLMARVLKRERVGVFTGRTVTGVDVSPAGINLSFTDASGTKDEIEADKLVVAAGRTPCSGRLGLEKAGVAISPKGFIEVDQGMRTNVPGIFAAGDVTGKMQLAHVASRQAMVAVENMFGGDAEMCYDAVPQCVYTDPELASIGKVEAAVGPVSVKTGMFPASANGRSLIEGATDGFSKVIIDSDSRAVLGVHLAGPNVTEMISGMAGTILWESTPEDMHSFIYAHPSVSEMIHESFLDVDGMAIHV